MASDGRFFQSSGHSWESDAELALIGGNEYSTWQPFLWWKPTTRRCSTGFELEEAGDIWLLHSPEDSSSLAPPNCNSCSVENFRSSSISRDENGTVERQRLVLLVDLPFGQSSLIWQPRNVNNRIRVVFHGGVASKRPSSWSDTPNWFSLDKFDSILTSERLDIISPQT